MERCRLVRTVLTTRRNVFSHRWRRKGILPKGNAKIPHLDLQALTNLFSEQNISKDSRIDWDEWKVYLDCLVSFAKFVLKISTSVFVRVSANNLLRTSQRRR